MSGRDQCLRCGLDAVFLYHYVIGVECGDCENGDPGAGQRLGDGRKNSGEREIERALDLENAPS